jgi:hypothetical protein
MLISFGFVGWLRRYRLGFFCLRGFRFEPFFLADEREIEHRCEVLAKRVVGGDGQRAPVHFGDTLERLKLVCGEEERAAERDHESNRAVVRRNAAQERRQGVTDRNSNCRDAVGHRALLSPLKFLCSVMAMTLDGRMTPRRGQNAAPRREIA